MGSLITSKSASRYFNIKLDLPLIFLYTISMKKIEKSFKKYGFDFKQIKRVGDVAIFEQSKPEWPAGDVRYETVKIGRHNGYYMGGQKITAAETYPGNSLWGIQGWTDTSLEKAEQRFKKACKRFNKNSTFKYA